VTRVQLARGSLLLGAQEPQSVVVTYFIRPIIHGCGTLLVRIIRLGVRTRMLSSSGTQLGTGVCGMRGLRGVWGGHDSPLPRLRVGGQQMVNIHIIPPDA